MRIVRVERVKADELGIVYKCGLFESIKEVFNYVDKQFKGFPPYLGCKLTVDKEIEATFKLLNVDYLKEEHKPAWKRTPKFVRWLKENNISYNEFAKLVGVHKTTVCRWANKQTTPNADYRKKITEVMKNYKGDKNAK